MDDGNSIFLRPGDRVEPTYTLIPLVRTPIVDPGGTFEVDLFFTGAGVPAERKLTVYHGHPKLVDEEDPGEIISTVNWVDDELVYGEEAVDHEAMNGGQFSRYGFMAMPSNAHFYKKSHDDDFYEDWDYNPKISETANDGEAPLQYRLNISEEAVPGDYEIKYAFTYGERVVGDEKRVEQDIQSVNLHVTTKRERLEPIPTYAGIIAAALALLSLLYSAGILRVLSQIIGV